MSTPDERIVKISFDNAQFQAGVQSTLKSLDDLNKGLKLQGATKGLQDLGSAANGIKLDGIGAGVDAIKNKFTSLSVIGIAAVANLASKAVDAGVRMTKAFTLDPIKAGFQNYETQINAVQTILANTGLKGAAGLKTVSATLDELNTYANQTVYSFSEMAKNVGTFTAAGVKLDVAQDAIKGIANLAALSGSNADQASTAMYQLSQAVAANKVGAQDWISVVNAGIGGKVFQGALFDTAQKLGTIKSAKMGETFEQWEGAGNSFKNSLQDGWITGEVLTKTLSQFTGDLTDAQLKSQGYNAEQIKQIQELAKTAKGAATNIKTYTQLTSALKEEVASAYATIFKTVFGDINQATALFTPLHNVIQNLITGPINTLNLVLKGWVQFGGKVALFDAIKVSFQDLGKLIAPIKEAFREIFPAKTGKDLAYLSKSLDDFVKGIKIGAETTAELKSTFAGLFAVVDIVWQVIKQTAVWLGTLLGPVIGQGSSGLLKFTGSIGDMLVKFDAIVKKGQGLNAFFAAIGKVLSPVLNFIGDLVKSLGNLPSLLQSAFSGVGSFFEKIPDMISTAFQAIAGFFQNMFGDINFDDVMKGLETGLFAVLVLSIKGLIGKLKDAFGGGGGGGNPFAGIIGKITEPFEHLTDTLKTMQKTLNVTILLEIAAAVAVLTLSVIGLSKINQEDLTKALNALALMFVQLFAALAAFNKIGGVSGMISTGAGLILIATAIRILVSSVSALGGMDMDTLKKGLGSLVAILAALILTVRGMSAQSEGMITSGAGLILLAAAIKILVSSVQDFSTMSWTEIAKGLSGVATLLLALTLFTKFAETNKGGIAQGAGIILLAAGIKILASAAQDFGKMDWNSVAKGLTSITAILAAIAIFSKTAGNPGTLLASGVALNGIAAAMIIFAKAMAAFGAISWENTAKGLISMGVTLGIVAVAMNALPKGMIASAAGLIIVSEALVIIAKALGTMGKMSWEEIAKGLVTLAGALTIIAVAVIFMEESLPGAAAILVVSFALGMLADALVKMGDQSWEDMGKGLATLAAAFVILGVAGLALTPVAPTLLILGAAITLLGVGVAALGAGVLLLGIGLTAIAASGAAAAAAITAIVTAVLALLVPAANAIGAFLVALSAAVIKATPAIVAAAVVLIDGILKVIVAETPKILAALVSMINSLLSALANAVPGFLDRATKIILAILDGLARNIPKVVTSIANMLVQILNAIAAKLPSLVTAGVNLVVNFLAGIGNNINKAIDAGVDLVVKFLQGIANAAVKFARAAGDMVVDFLEKLAGVIREEGPEIGHAGANIATAMVQGLIGGLTAAASDIFNAILGPLKSAWNGVKSFFGIKSPSTLMRTLGGYITQGLVLGLEGGAANVQKTFTNMNKNILTAMSGLKTQIDKYSQQLTKLQTAQQKNPVAIYLTQLALASLRGEYAKAAKAEADWTSGHNAQYNKLVALGKQYDAYTTKIQAATAALTDAKKVQADFIKSTTEQFNNLPDIGADTQLPDYVNDLTDQVADLKKFTEVLTQLRKLGLNDAEYSALLAKGPDALGFAEQLLAGGASAVKQVDSLSDQLGSAATAMGKAAGDALYQAGVNAAAGLLAGLQKQQAAINVQMAQIAAAMVAKIKHDLGIKSPSTVFAEVGGYITEGLAKGLTSTSSVVTDATEFVAKAAVDSMSKALSDANDLMINSENLTPVIAPVVDLSNVSKGVSQLGSMLSDKQLGIEATFSMAKDASVGYSANKATSVDVSGEPTPPAAPVSVVFNQNNNSPKALSPAEIYRQTNNQLSRAKGALANVTPKS